jgi:RecB family exonuclease
MLDIKQGKQVSLRGLIDRVDETESGSKLILIDYKFGKSYSHKDMDKDELGGGKHLQLPVYAMAIKNVMGESVEVEALYWFASARGNFDRKSVRLGEVEERFHKMIEIIASGIEQGLFPANPGSAENPLENCGYCDFDRICPANRDLIWEQKSQSGEVAHYLKLRDLEPPGDNSQ